MILLLRLQGFIEFYILKSGYLDYSTTKHRAVKIF